MDDRNEEATRERARLHFALDSREICNETSHEVPAAEMRKNYVARVGSRKSPGSRFLRALSRSRCKTRRERQTDGVKGF